jgi:hypothetical protein
MAPPVFPYGCPGIREIDFQWRRLPKLFVEPSFVVLARGCLFTLVPGQHTLGGLPGNHTAALACAQMDSG